MRQYRYLTTDQVAGRRGCASTTVNREIATMTEERRTELGIIKEKKKWMIPGDSVDDFTCLKRKEAQNNRNVLPDF